MSFCPWVTDKWTWLLLNSEKDVINNAEALKLLLEYIFREWSDLRRNCDAPVDAQL